MKPEITIRKVWNDDDIVEYEINVSNGYSVFSNKVYAGLDELNALIDSLEIFRNHLYGGLKDIQFGSFGPEYANGAFLARLHFPKPSTLYISTHQQSDHFEFKNRKEASECKMYLSTEPILLDNFIQRLKSLNTGVKDIATLECT